MTEKDMNLLSIIILIVAWTIAGCTINVIQAQSDDGGKDSVHNIPTSTISPDINIPFLQDKKIGL